DGDDEEAREVAGQRRDRAGREQEEDEGIAKAGEELEHGQAPLPTSRNVGAEAREAGSRLRAAETAGSGLGEVEASELIGREQGQPTATLISCTFGCLLFGRVTCSIPFFSSAFALEASTSMASPPFSLDGQLQGACHPRRRDGARGASAFPGSAKGADR